MSVIGSLLLDPLAAALVAASLLAYEVAWHLSAGALERVLIPVAVTLRVALFLVVLTTLDRLLRPRAA